MFGLGPLLACTMGRERPVSEESSSAALLPSRLLSETTSNTKEREQEIFRTQPFLLGKLKPPSICVPVSLPRNTYDPPPQGTCQSSGVTVPVPNPMGELVSHILLCDHRKT